jgi:hypothetical protein
MRPKEEEEIKKTFVYKYNALAFACQKFKAEVMKAYGKPFLILSNFIGGVIASIRTEREYRKELNYFSKTNSYNPSDIVYVALHSPLTLYEASEIYPLAQVYHLDKYQVAVFGFQADGDVIDLKRLIIENAEKQSRKASEKKIIERIDQYETRHA